MDFTKRLHDDLKNTKLRLKKKGWDDDSLNATINEYGKFLYLCQLYPGQLVPGKRIDQVWHDHILHTQRYTNFCETEFGRYIHHVPKELSDDEKLESTETYELYEKTFGYKPSDVYWANKHKAEPDCGDCRGT